MDSCFLKKTKKVTECSLLERMNLDVARFDKFALEAETEL